MTLEEASERYGIAIRKLRLYESEGLLFYQNDVKGVPDYLESDFKKIGMIHVLAEAGMEPEELRKFFGLSGENRQEREEKIRILKKCRADLLEEIHQKQQVLDRIDYCVYELKKA